MDAKELPARPSLEQYKKQAKELVKKQKTGDSEIAGRIRQHHPRLQKLSGSQFRNAKVTLADAQLVIAREHGFQSWVKFAQHIAAFAHARAAAAVEDPPAAFIRAAVWHGSLERAEAILAAHPALANSSIYTAAILGDEAGVRRLLDLDTANATAKGGPLGWDALTYLSFSKYLRLKKERSEGFLRAAKALLDAGASANTGFYEPNHQPNPEWESALYGAAGVAHHAEMTRLLIEHGADPNNGEVSYHSPESPHNEE